MSTKGAKTRHMLFQLQVFNALYSYKSDQPALMGIMMFGRVMVKAGQ